VDGIDSVPCLVAVFDIDGESLGCVSREMFDWLSVLAMKIAQAFCLQKLPSVGEEHLSVLREIGLGGKFSDISNRKQAFQQLHHVISRMYRRQFCGPTVGSQTNAKVKLVLFLTVV
jgi:hypothetical protein